MQQYYIIPITFMETRRVKPARPYLIDKWGEDMVLITI
jgi:hypothetical protein